MTCTPPDAPVELAPYDPAWPSRFDQERIAIRGALGDLIVGSIEHVGSTAIPGVEAKPILDIMVGIRDLSAPGPLVPLLGRIGYLHYPYRPDVMHWFCKPLPSFRTHHVHAVPVGSRLWRERIAFRDYLRAHADVATAYVELKRQLAASHRFDREAYTDGKSSFVRKVLGAAMLEDGGPG
jgi:GrpB-like predicted nucleotidyltransferase (UPF0157 family)